jgi:uncharacterized SAM-binding protein YcdF (DUF218 family)
MFYLAKILAAFFQPSSLLVLLFAAAAVFGMLGKVRPALRLFASGAALYIIFGFSPLANLMLAPLELNAEANAATDLDGAAGIIVLGGGIANAPSLADGAPHLNEAGDRMVEAVRLAARYPSLPVLFCGGKPEILPTWDSETEAAPAERFFRGFGLVPPRLTLEDRSRTTFENAMQAARILQPKPGQKWILVSSAFHMPRAKALFEAQGFEILARPVDFRTDGFYGWWRIFPRAGDGLKRMDLAVKEWSGLAMAWLTGNFSRQRRDSSGPAGV